MKKTEGASKIHRRGMAALGTTRHYVIYPFLTPTPVQLKKISIQTRTQSRFPFNSFYSPCLSSSFPSDKQSIISLVLELYH